jgi:HemK-like putative methylase
MTPTTFSTLSLLTAPGRVMKPRPASELLVEAAVSWLDGRQARVVDVGTGSGAIAIAIAAAAPAAEVWATDTSDAAVALARTNVHRHRLADRVTVSRGDLLAAVPGVVDLVVANLPYLPRAAAASHPDLAAEPPEAVFAAGDGLDPYRRLLVASAERLSAGGAVIIQLHRRVLQAGRDELSNLSSAIEQEACDHSPPAISRTITARTTPVVTKKNSTANATIHQVSMIATRPTLEAEATPATPNVIRSRNEPRGAPLVVFVPGHASSTSSSPMLNR